jgi:pimeloyl-ACP methyl ester carboxylesterase
MSKKGKQILQQTSSSRRRTVKARLLRAFLCVSIIVFALLSTGALYQVIGTALDKHHFPPSGQMVDIGGYKLHLDCRGTGSPTVILEAGLGDTTLVWSKVQPTLAMFTRVCSYDRAGYAWSNAGPTPRTGKQIITELHTLLAKANVPGPYILVGHSLGGLFVRLYASTYPQQVVGMVLIDASHEDQQLNLSPQARQSLNQEVQSHYFNQWLTLFGIQRLGQQLHLVPSDEFKDYAPSVIPILKAYQAQPSFFRTYADELAAFDETAAEVYASTRNLGNMPLVVLSHGLPVPLSLQRQEFFGDLSSRSTLVVASHSGHYIQLEQPDLVIDAIRQALKEEHLS